MYPHLRIWHPVAVLATLVATAVLATSTVTVHPDQTLSEIAQRNDVTVAQLVAWNDIHDPDRIRSGATLIIAGGETPAAGGSAPDFHRVAAGETLSAIALRFGTTVGRLVSANALGNADRIYSGQQLRLAGNGAPVTPTTPSPARTHTVAPGETLGGIAARFDIAAGVLAHDNNITDPDRIIVGMRLVIGAPERAAGPNPASPLPSSTSQPASTSPQPTRTGRVLLIPLFARWSGVYNVPRDLLEAIAWRESDWNPAATGANGRLGITQLSPDTVEFIEGGLLGRDLDPFGPSDGIQMGARYLRYLLDHTGSEREATAAWTQGLPSVLRDGVNTAGAASVDAVEEIRRQRG